MSQPRRRGSGKRKRRPSAARATRATTRQPRRRGAEKAPDPANAPETVAAPARSAAKPTERQRLRPRVDASETFAEAAVLHADQMHVARKHPTLVFSVQWDVLTCAALCALGTSLGLTAVLSEMRYHFALPSGGLAFTIAALCVGVVLGLWVPRRIIRQRLARGPGQTDRMALSDIGGPRSLKLEFAASLAGVLVLACALTWVVLGGGVALMEGYRTFLVRRFAHPPWLALLLLSGPAMVGLIVAGAIGTTLLVALHGWYRLATQPKTRIARLWASILFGTLLAGVLAARIGSNVALAGLAPLTVFVAGVVAVLRRSDAMGMSTPPLARPRPNRDEWLSLLTAGLAAALIGGALVLTIPTAGVTAGGLSAGVIVVAAGAGAGLVAARLIARLRLGADPAPLVLLLTAIALLLPYQQLLSVSVGAALVRLLAVTGCAAACMVLIGQRVDQVHHSIQCSLSWVGRAVAAGLGLTMLLLPAATAAWSSSAGVTILSVGAAAGAAFALLLGSRVNPGLRMVGMSCVMLWLAGAPLAHRTLLRSAPSMVSQPSSNPLAAAARRLLTADHFEAAFVRPSPPSAAGAVGWQFDLGGSTLDLIVLESVPEEADEPTRGDNWQRRLLGRLATRLADGGRLLVELPTPAGMVEALRSFNPEPDRPGWAGHRLRISSETYAYEALVFGRDIPALIARNERASELQVALQPLSAQPEFGR